MQDRLKEKDAEIERTRNQAAREIAQCYEDLRERDAEIERLKAANLAYSNEVALSEREIERLKAEIRKLKSEQEFDVEAPKIIVRQVRIISDLKVLLTRAADALDHVLPIKTYAFLDWYPYYDLKDELRKAAQ